MNANPQLAKMVIAGIATNQICLEGEGTFYPDDFVYDLGHQNVTLAGDIESELQLRVALRELDQTLERIHPDSHQVTNLQRPALVPRLRKALSGHYSVK